jgi:hypothetical protein
MVVQYICGGEKILEKIEWKIVQKEVGDYIYENKNNKNDGIFTRRGCYVGGSSRHGFVW